MVPSPYFFLKFPTPNDGDEHCENSEAHFFCIRFFLHSDVGGQ